MRLTTGDGRSVGGSALGGGRSLPSRHLNNWTDIQALMTVTQPIYSRLNACDIQDFAHENL